MYNTEKYIGECLDSILAQTFQNYEVIVVDDCSTDNSAAIVESYIPKFGGRLKLYHMEKNSGGCAMPRNKGLPLSRGEYVFFMDADDLFTKTALEEIYVLAKDYDADVVYTEKHYEASNDLSGMRVRGRQYLEFVDKPTLEVEDLTERLQKLLRGGFGITTWITFIRRDILIDNKISFPNTKGGEDIIWTWGLVFYAKRFLRVPNAVYIQRLSEGSIMRTKKTLEQHLSFQLNCCILGVKFFDNLIGKSTFFKQNPQYRYAMVEFFVRTRFDEVFRYTNFQLSPFTVYETIKQQFGDKLGEQDVLVSALCTLVNTQQKMFVANQQKFNEFAAQAQEQVKKFNEFAAQAQARIAELEAQLKTK